MNRIQATKLKLEIQKPKKLKIIMMLINKYKQNHLSTLLVLLLFLNKKINMKNKF